MTMFTIPVDLEPPITRSVVEKETTDKPAQSFVTCIHIVKLADIFCSITVTWAKTMISHTLYITVEDPHDGDNHYTCKIDLKTWQFWGKKGLKTFKVGDKRFDVFWDLRSAKFKTSPEPDSGYYVAMVSNGEMVLLLGEQKNEAMRRAKARPALQDASLVQKKEIVFAKKCFCTKTTLGRAREHNIMIESSLSGPYDPEMWISVDGMESIRVPNLHWRFRGNEAIMVGGVAVQILWDVHDWLYSGSHSGAGIFVFMRRADEGVGGHGRVEAEDRVNGFWDVLEDRPSSTIGFCHFVYAWMTD